MPGYENEYVDNQSIKLLDAPWKQPAANGTRRPQLIFTGLLNQQTGGKVFPRNFG
jgi:hypothetical protein